MDDRAAEILKEVETRHALEPMTREDANAVAEAWRTIGVDAGLSRDALDRVVEVNLTDYILQVFGEIGQELRI